MTEHSSEPVWEEFYKRYYWEQLLSLAGIYPESKSLVIEFPDIERYDLELATELLETPTKVLDDANNALRKKISKYHQKLPWKKNW